MPSAASLQSTCAAMTIVGSRNALTPMEAGQMAQLALAEQREAECLAAVAATASRVGDDARLWQWTALLHRGLDDRGPAIAAYERAVALAPTDLRIVHGLARTRLEAGKSCLRHYRRALELAPFDGEILLGMAAAQVAEGQVNAALAGLEAVLAQEPRWLDGQQQAAHLRFILGAGASFTEGLERALRNCPTHEGLWQLLLMLKVQADAYEHALDAAYRAKNALGVRPFITATLAIAASHLGQIAAADVNFAVLDTLGDAAVAVHHVRHLLRTSRFDSANRAIDHWLEKPEKTSFYPYAAVTWRHMSDPRQAWLDGHGELVKTFDLCDRLPSLDRLADTLRGLHHAGGASLDQSVRGGTQTDGPLLANIDADIQATRHAILWAVGEYVRGLPPHDLLHPMLGLSRDKPVRFAGSWSVRLTGAGRHANHVHPAGWISSSLYIALPTSPDGNDPNAGWLTLGEPPHDLGLSLTPTGTIKPKPGMLVLFPSIMWHGTRPFSQGERLTVAFDIAPPIVR